MAKKEANPLEGTVTRNPAQAAKDLEVGLETGVAMMFHGEPGIGKSQIVRQYAEQRDLAFIDLRAVLLDPVDLRGLPHINGDELAHWAQPAFLPREGMKPGVLLLDEINRAPTLVQNACFQLVLDRQLGEYRLPDNWKIVAAGNRESDGGGITRMPSALSNRFIHINVTADLDSWCDWAYSHNINGMVIGFLRFKPNLLAKFDRNADAYPTPRSWEFVSKIVDLNANRDTEIALVSGAVGHEAAMEFQAFVQQYRSLPDMDELLKNPEKAAVPEDVCTLYAIASALSMKANEKNFDAVIKYLNRCSVEYNVFAIKGAVTRDNTLISTPSFTKWASTNAEAL